MYQVPGVVHRTWKDVEELVRSFVRECVKIAIMDMARVV